MKKPSKKPRECPMCGGRLRRDVRREKYGYNDKEVTVLQPGDYCDDCGDCLLSRADIKATEKEINEALGIGKPAKGGKR